MTLEDFARVFGLRAGVLIIMEDTGGNIGNLLEFLDDMGFTREDMHSGNAIEPICLN